ncbi:MAG TPA: aldo/keto reductase, partial [Symbiobacteriaceae bacterium]|nr:aldo/keto reductase [Symbiobacteriaceae bacterium]
MAIAYVKLGWAGVKVSSVCLGCMNFGWRTGEQDAIRMVHQALDAGINFLDTANVYGKGLSETIVGKALKGRRDQVVLATKVHGKMGDGPNDRGNNRFHILQQVDESLRRLQADHIDLYQIHRPDADTPVDETLRTLDDLVKAGKVRYFGLSTFPAWQIVEALWTSDRLGLERIVSEQPPYHLLDRRVEAEVLPLARKFGVAILPWSPLAGGMLTGKYRAGAPMPEDSRGAHRWKEDEAWYQKRLATVEKLVPLAEEMGVSLTQFALAWVMHQPGVTSPILGPRTTEQLADNLAA